MFDWTIPREWNIRDAYISNSGGDKIVDFAQSNLHVMSYSVPVRKHLSLAELKKITFTRCLSSRTLSPTGPRIMPRTGRSA